jgi:hypothetical protein
MTEAGTTGVRQPKSAEAQKFIVNNRPTLKAAGQKAAVAYNPRLLGDST